MLMALRDEKTFTDEEWIAAFSIVLPPEQARAEALGWNSLPDPKGFEDATPEELRAAGVNGPRSYDGDLLDLLSLVSDDCAERAWSLMGISREEGEHRRAAFRRRVDDALRARDKT
jgi:hypothetical protein